MMDRMKMQSKDRTQENFERLAALFPNAVTETIDENGVVVRAIDKDVLQQEISAVVVEGRDERYQFTWPDKKKSILAANAPVRKTLRPCREESVDFDTTENLYIEGDNLDVLKMLQETYLGRVKMIYIDPPYNTGHDLVYNDDFRADASEYLENSGQLDDEGHRLFQNTESNGRFHTDWLNMLYPRLKIARDLLSDDGVIFISIDDGEIEELRLICNEIFGECNFVGCISRATGTTTGQDANKIGSSLDYCVAYSKTSSFILKGIDMDEKDKKRFNEFDDRGQYSVLQLRKTGNADRREDRPNMFYAITAPDGSEVYPFGPGGYLSRWRVAKDSYDKLVLEDMIVWKKTEGTIPLEIEGYMKSAWTPYVKYYLEGRTKQMSNLLLDIEGNKKASLVLKDLLGSKGIFENPKPVEFVSRLIQIATDDDSIVVDFFSGSATTAHAIMMYNAEKTTSLRYIMVQLPEPCDEKSEAYKAGYKTISDIGMERIRRAGAKIKAENPLVAQSLDTGFRVLKLDSTNMKDVYYNPHDVQMSILDDLEGNIKEDRTPEDLLFQVMLDLGILLSSKIETTEIAGKSVFSVADNFLIACFDENVSDETITAVAKSHPAYFVMRDSSMKDDSVATNFDQIFAIYSPDTVRKVI